MINVSERSYVNSQERVYGQARGASVLEKSVDCPCCAVIHAIIDIICPDQGMSKSISSSCTSVLEKKERKKVLTVHVVHAVIYAIIDIICPDRAMSKSINS